MIEKLMGIPIATSDFLPDRSAFLVVRDKDVVTQMIEVYNEAKGLLQAARTADLIAEKHLKGR